MEHERGQIDSPTRAKRLSTSHYSNMVDADWSVKGSLTVWALYAYFSVSKSAAFELLVWCM